MDKNLRKGMYFVEYCHGISGILDEVATFSRDCASVAKDHGDIDGSNQYFRSAAEIETLAEEIKKKRNLNQQEGTKTKTIEILDFLADRIEHGKIVIKNMPDEETGLGRMEQACHIEFIRGYIDLAVELSGKIKMGEITFG